MRKNEPAKNESAKNTIRFDQLETLCVHKSFYIFIHIVIY